MASAPLCILFVDERNAACSIMAQAILARVGGGVFDVYSAGRDPAGLVDAHAQETLSQTGYKTDDLHPKNWKDFLGFSAPNLDAVITLEDSLKKASMPMWYSNPVVVHWPFSNPETTSGGDREKQEAYRRLYGALEQQMLKLAGLKLDNVDANTLKTRLQSIAPKG